LIQFSDNCGRLRSDGKKPIANNIGPLFYGAILNVSLVLHLINSGVIGWRIYARAGTVQSE